MSNNRAGIDQVEILQVKAALASGKSISEVATQFDVYESVIESYDAYFKENKKSSPSDVGDDKPAPKGKKAPAN